MGSPWWLSPPSPSVRGRAGMARTRDASLTRKHEFVVFGTSNVQFVQCSFCTKCQFFFHRQTKKLPQCTCTCHVPKTSNELILSSQEPVQVRRVHGGADLRLPHHLAGGSPR